MSESESENDSDENENNDGSQIEFNLSESGDEGDKSDESDTENIERNTRGISKNYIPMEEFDDYNSALNHVMESPKILHQSFQFRFFFCMLNL